MSLGPCWQQPGMGLAIVDIWDMNQKTKGIWGVNHWMKDLATWLWEAVCETQTVVQADGVL